MKPNSLPTETIEKFPALQEKYEIHNYGSAIEILTQAYPQEWDEICHLLNDFVIYESEIIKGGGNESDIPKKIANFLTPRQWQETKLSADLVVRQKKRNSKEEEQFIIKDYMVGYNIDHLKNKVAFDVEWNSKDQTFDRDLSAFRAFHENGIISCGIILTRSVELNDIFHDLEIMKKYGASTTQMGKLLPRVKARRQGGCPLLIIGIKSPCVIRASDVDNS
ncbi:BglII/BstYI family type II restriction endonuclease [Methanolobus sediminis]|uniref:BglII/BstYI family type II restriction endonuclease n=1 Tax=Methanolobus sediminis TaxID=3072978 RepID=A0AA51UJI2_9EURY|nr:BglII/BstYI family type II restriction endonuclease [Methanolobus sediminis]WMW24684.1 BglII/BstYI family type II restriction endonuclease [Methanolobus sediminis]